MAIELNVNPSKSFRFVTAVKEVTTRATSNRPTDPQQGLDVVSPGDLRNASRKSAISVQSRITHQDRLIDIVV